MLGKPWIFLPIVLAIAMVLITQSDVGAAQMTTLSGGGGSGGSTMIGLVP